MLLISPLEVSEHCISQHHKHQSVVHKLLSGYQLYFSMLKDSVWLLRCEKLALGDSWWWKLHTGINTLQRRNTQELLSFPMHTLIPLFFKENILCVWVFFLSICMYTMYIPHVGRDWIPRNWSYRRRKLAARWFAVTWNVTPYRVWRLAWEEVGRSEEEQHLPHPLLDYFTDHGQTPRRKESVMVLLRPLKILLWSVPLPAGPFSFFAPLSSGSSLSPLCPTPCWFWSSPP